MKTYTQLLDILILSMLALAIIFYLTNHSVSNSFNRRDGHLHISVISWQSLLLVSSFCVFLRYIARNVR